MRRGGSRRIMPNCRSYWAGVIVWLATPLAHAAKCLATLLLQKTPHRVEMTVGANNGEALVEATRAI